MWSLTVSSCWFYSEAIKRKACKIYRPWSKKKGSRRETADSGWINNGITQHFQLARNSRDTYQHGGTWCFGAICGYPHDFAFGDRAKIGLLTHNPTIFLFSPYRGAWTTLAISWYLSWSLFQKSRRITLPLFPILWTFGRLRKSGSTHTSPSQSFKKILFWFSVTAWNTICQIAISIACLNPC